jgi:hypothetical protein
MIFLSEITVCTIKCSQLKGIKLEKRQQNKKLYKLTRGDKVKRHKKGAYKKGWVHCVLRNYTLIFITNLFQDAESKTWHTCWKENRAAKQVNFLE